MRILKCAETQTAFVATLVAMILLRLGQRRRVTNTRVWSSGVAVRASLIPASGDGLFALKPFAKNNILGEYRQLQQSNRACTCAVTCANVHTRGTEGRLSR